MKITVKVHGSFPKDRVTSPQQFKKTAVGLEFEFDGPIIEIAFDVLSGGSRPQVIVESFYQLFNYNSSQGTLSPSHGRNYYIAGKPAQLHKSTQSPQLNWSGSHPRIEGQIQSLTNQIFQVNVDLAFVDATQTLASSNPKLVKSFASENHFGCGFQPLEQLERNGDSFLWLATIPPSVLTNLVIAGNPFRSEKWKPDSSTSATDATEKFGILCFFRPNSHVRYEASFDLGAEASRIESYLFGGPDPGGIFVDAKYDPKSKKNKFQWYYSNRKAFEFQLAAARKKVVFVQPWPKEANYGSSTGPSLISSLNSILVCLQCLGTIAQGCKKKVSANRIAVAGYSLGGGNALKVWNNATLRGKISEFYFFDPNSAVSAMPTPPDIKRWLNGDPSRCVRLIGGSLEHARSLAILDQALGVTWKAQSQQYDDYVEGRSSTKASRPNAWCRPFSLDFWTGKTEFNIYSWAFYPWPSTQANSPAPVVAATLDPTVNLPPLLQNVGATPLTDPSKWIGLTLSKSDWKSSNVVNSSSKLNFLVNHSICELSGFSLTYWKETLGMAAVSSHDDAVSFNASANDVLKFGRQPKINKSNKAQNQPGGDLGLGVRHQWAIFGGTWAKRGAQVTYQRYLGLCLRDSGFP